MMRWLALLAFLLLPSLAHAQATVVTSCGSTTLSAGTSHFVTVDTNGQSCQSGAGSGATGCSQATAYLARATGETVHAADLTTLICGLVSDGVWPKLDALYVLAQQTQADSLLNLVGTSYPLTYDGSTFTAYQGFSAFVTGLNTGFNATGSHYVLNSASAGVWAYEATDGNALLGNTVTGPITIFSSVVLGGTFAAWVNANTGFYATPGTTGLFAGDRSLSTEYHGFYNGVDLGAQVNGSSFADNNSVYIGSGGVGGYVTAKKISAAFIGASLGGAGQTALYNRLRTYLTSVGVP